MSNTEKEILKVHLIQSLIKRFGLREATSMASYYFEAKSDFSTASVDKDIELLLAGYPIQYVTNVSFFYGHKFYVEKNVLIPRPETEELVHWIISDYKSSESNVRILDIGAGSGCIILSLLKGLNHCEGAAVDINPDAIRLVKKNARHLDVVLSSYVMDIMEDSAWNILGSYDIIVCNPPYILPEEKIRMGDSVLKHEPEDALFVTNHDPLQFYRRVLEMSKNHLSENGSIYFETSDLYHKELLDLMESSGLKHQFKKDMQGNWRMLKIFS